MSSLNQAELCEKVQEKSSGICFRFVEVFGDEIHKPENCVFRAATSLVEMLDHNLFQ